MNTGFNFVSDLELFSQLKAYKMYILIQNI